MRMIGLLHERPRMLVVPDLRAPSQRFVADKQVASGRALG